MAIAKPWLTSSDLINIIKQRIAIPTSQETYDTDTLLDTINGELFDSQVPSVMILHEEFFVNSKEVTLQANKSRYPMPDRAMGMKLRDVFYQDSNGNLTKLSRVNPDNKDIFQSNNLNNFLPYTFYVEGNDIVFNVSNNSTMVGTLLMSFFLRPNKLTQNENAFIVSSFGKQLTVTNSSIVAGNTVTITDSNGTANVFTAVASSASTNQFVIGVSSIATASNLVAAINTNGVVTASNGAVATNLIQTTHYDRGMTFVSSNSTGITISSNLQLNSTSTVPSTITNNSYVDFLQTKPGHKIYSYDILLGSNAVSGSTLSIDDSDVPDDFVLNDYVCAQYTCIIPQLPPELHSLLAERACSRILSSQGDMEALQATSQKIQDLTNNQNTLIDNRVEGTPQKVINRSSHLASRRRGRFF